MRESVLRLSTVFYSKESAELAARTLAGRGEFRLRPAKGAVEVRVRARADADGAALAADFADEALNQECRRDLLARNREVQRAVLTVMLATARSNRKKGER